MTTCFLELLCTSCPHWFYLPVNTCHCMMAKLYHRQTDVVTVSTYNSISSQSLWQGKKSFLWYKYNTESFFYCNIWLTTLIKNRLWYNSHTTATRCTQTSFRTPIFQICLCYLRICMCNLWNLLYCMYIVLHALHSLLSLLCDWLRKPKKCIQGLGWLVGRVVLQPRLQGVQNY